MAIDWNPQGDFAAVIDTLEPVTLVRRDTAEEVPIAGAWRYRQRHAESQPADGRVTAADLIWQFEWDPAEPLPAVGDQLCDAAGECYTLLAVDRLQGPTRLRCETRNLRIAQGLDHLVDIEQAVWDDQGSGPEIVGWTTYLEDVPARVQPLEVTVDESADPITSTATYHILLAESLELDHNHRFVTGDGTTYRLLSYTAAERIDAVSVAVVRREAS